jgi:hypothetical protein
MRHVVADSVVVSLFMLTLPYAALAGQEGMSGSEQARAQPQEQYAASEPMVRQTVRGRLIVGTLEGVIESSTGTMYYFATKDRIARQLMAACRGADFCEADVMLDSGEIMRVRSARPVLKAALSDKERDEWSKRLSNK